MEKTVTNPQKVSLSEAEVKKLEATLENFPPENALDYYQRHLCSCNHAKLSKFDQEAALSILKILQSLN